MKIVKDLPGCSLFGYGVYNFFPTMQGRYLCPDNNPTPADYGIVYLHLQKQTP
jgi:hypothetical protein